MDHFKNFRRFAPEGDYETFYRENVVSVARKLMRLHPREEIFLVYNSIRPNGIVEITRSIAVPDSPEEIDKLLRGIKTDRMHLGICGEDITPYILQNIQIGEQKITQVERAWGPLRTLLP